MSTSASNQETHVEPAASTGQLSKPGRALAILILSGAVAVAVLSVTLSVTLDNGGLWIDAAAVAGMVATVIAAAVMLGTRHGWANGTSMSLASIATGVIGVGAIALAAVTYIGGMGDDGISGSAVANQTSEEGIALTEQVSNNEIQPPGYAHDIGVQPTINQFLTFDDAQILRSVPGGTVLPTEVDALRSELTAAREFALQFDTVEKAYAAGYNKTTNDVPFMGAHFLNNQYLTDGVFDAGKPEGLLFSKLGNPDNDWTLVGVWYLLLPGQGGATVDSPPEGFSGSLDLWHTHHGLCTRAGVISEDNSAESCAADSGNFIGDLRWMMHAWVYPEAGVDNSEGVFVYLNSDLFEAQSQAQVTIID
ncbi:MAG: hypothetical protein IIB88_07295 [Chloroflexi bacterium]|nr:hypothetical protein [Chloroflexota bacterium]